MSFFPFFQNIEGKTFLIVGKGEIARRKQRLLEQFTDRIRLFPEPPPGSPSFSEKDLEGVDFCIASTDDSDENRRIAMLCHAAGVPVNVPDDPSLCSFYLPSVIKKGDLVVAVSTGGKSPAMAAHLRRQIEEQLDKSLPADVEEVLGLMGKLRKWLPSLAADGKSRRKIYGTILQELLDGTLKAEESAIRARAVELQSQPAAGEGKQRMNPSGEKKQYSFFQNRACEYFPCHQTKDPENFNCLFCYCPLYALGKKCGGNFRYTEKGIKDCTGCDFPHRRENYKIITGRFAEIMDVVKQTDACGQVCGDHGFRETD